MTIQHGFRNVRPFFRKLAIFLSLYAIGTSFLCFSAIRYFLHGETWMGSAGVLGGVICAMAAFALFSYYCFLVLDGQHLRNRRYPRGLVAGVTPQRQGH